MRVALGPAFGQSAQAAARFWERLKEETDLNWVYLSLPPGTGPGERTAGTATWWGTADPRSG